MKGYMMISNCLNCSKDVQKNCSSPEPSNHTDETPVEGPNGNTYKNRFCALGNGIHPEKIRHWRYELLCPLIMVYNSTQKLREIESRCTQNRQTCLPEDRAYLQNKCTWYYAPPLNITKYHTICSPVKTCPQTPAINITALKYKHIRQKCNSYMRVVYHNGTYYKNFHCALCYGIRPAEIQNPPIQGGSFPTITIFFKKPRNSFSIKYSTSNHGSSSIETAQSKLEMYINLIGLSVSMVTLLLLLALYSLVKELRTTPGKIIIGLSFSIVTYQIILLVSPQYTGNAVACSIVAIFQHLAILSSFAWMSVMSFDVWKTFGKNSK